MYEINLTSQKISTRCRHQMPYAKFDKAEKQYDLKPFHHVCVLITDMSTDICQQYLITLCLLIYEALFLYFEQ